MTFLYSKKHRFVGRHELRLLHEPESVCGDLALSLQAEEPKDRVSRITEGENSRSRAEGNRRDASVRVARQCAGGKPMCSVRVGYEEERAFRRVKTMRR